MKDDVSDLPHGWARVALADAVTPRGEKASPADHPGAPFIGMDHVEAHSGRIIGSVPAESMKSAAARFRPGDVLYGRLRPYLNKVAVPGFDGLASAEFMVFPGSEFLSSRYLAHRLRCSDFVNFASHLNEGDRPRVDFFQIGVFTMDVPPAREQQRIVAKIDELFSELDKAVESLTLARVQLKTYRQALLKAAFEGRLTADWRAANPDKLEPPETLLARIRTERDARYRQALADWQTALAEWRAGGEVGRKPPKPRNYCVDLPVKAEVGYSVGVLPSAWGWIRLHELCSESPKNGLYRPASEYGRGTQIVRIDDFYDGRLVKRGGFKLVTISKEEEEDYKIINGDIIVNRVNSIEYLGKCAVVSHMEATAIFESNIMRLRLLPTIVRPEWLGLYLSSFEGRRRVTHNAKHAVNQASINQNDVGVTLVPYCHIEEQHQIVAILETKLSEVDKVEAEIKDALIRTNGLRQSILKQAFSGRLVPQDPADEPAAALLARLRDAPPPARSRRRKTA